MTNSASNSIGDSSLNWNGFAIKVFRPATVYHIGALEIDQRGSRGSSYEGSCLSVSLCPLAWRKIAKLGGSPLNTLSIDGVGGLFLDMLALRDDTALFDKIKQWGLDALLIKEKVMWEARRCDEDGDDCYTLHSTQAEANAEVDFDDELLEDDDFPAVIPLTIFVGTGKLSAIALQKSLEDTDASDFLVMHWASTLLPGLHGVWWNEDYDPNFFSAPRGGIFPDKVAEWVIAPLSWDDYHEVEDPDDQDDDCDGDRL